MSSTFTARLSEASRAFRVELDQALTYSSPDLSPEGIGKERARRADAVRAKYRPVLAELKTEAQAARTFRARKAEEAMPAPTGSTADSWARVRMLLDAGRTLQQVIKTADVAQLQAIREWGPTWLEASLPAPNVLDGTADRAPVDASHIMRAVASRWAELSDEKGAAAIRSHLEAVPDHAGFDVAAGHLAAELDGVQGDPLAAALEARAAASAAGAGLPA